MREMINDKMKKFAASQEFFDNISDVTKQWDTSQLYLEKMMFDSLNNSDCVLNLSKEGRQLSSKLLECCDKIKGNDDTIILTQIAEIAEEIKTIFSKLVNSSKEASEISHTMEEHVNHQRQAAEECKASVHQIKENIDEAMACAEFLLTEMI